jgi:hypothetical protein
MEEKVMMINTSSTKLTMYATIRSLMVKLNFCGGFLATTGSWLVSTLSPGKVSGSCMLRFSFIHSFISIEEFIAKSKTGNDWLLCSSE